ncbi:MAG: hypothetical protein AMJ75_08160 [Phycisphaerae bacterium SM1_79]|nr:MAG: hypothetical protein AMJ75_08160 [Phycisphaerae bacterium SM1_79]
MPARRRKQSNAMLYTLITFIGLFIAATTVAVIYYVKAEDHRTRQADLQSEFDEYATSRERQAIGTLIGARPGAKTWIRATVDYLDQAISLVVGGVPQPTSAEVKVGNANTEVANALNLAQAHIDVGDPNNRTGLVQIVKGLTAELENAIKAQLATQQQLSDLQTRFANADQAHSEERQTLLAEKDKFVQQIADIQQQYDELSALLQQTTSQQVETLRAQRDQARADLNARNDELLETQARLKEAQEEMRLAKEEVSKIRPGPDREVKACEPDGNIMLIDDQARVVHLNIGSNKHVYPGLTFTVYDRGGSIPKDGKGKAEIQVFDVEETYSAARITHSEVKRPILQGDMIANLIWDSEKANVFVVVGDFDLDNDGNIDYDGVNRIRARIEKWGGTVADVVSVDTDFVVLGNQPKVLREPSDFELEVDPRARKDYEDSLNRLERYNDVRDQAQALWIPIFNYERFLYFIGYKAQIGRAGAF